MAELLHSAIGQCLYACMLHPCRHACIRLGAVGCERHALRFGCLAPCRQHAFVYLKVAHVRAWCDVCIARCACSQAGDDRGSEAAVLPNTSTNPEAAGYESADDDAEWLVDEHDKEEQVEVQGPEAGTQPHWEEPPPSSNMADKPLDMQRLMGILERGLNGGVVTATEGAELLAGYQILRTGALGVVGAVAAGPEGVARGVPPAKPLYSTTHQLLDKLEENVSCDACCVGPALCALDACLLLLVPTTRALPPCLPRVRACMLY